jgi:hypothetical protein
MNETKRYNGTCGRTMTQDSRIRQVERLAGPQAARAYREELVELGDVPRTQPADDNEPFGAGWDRDIPPAPLFSDGWQDRLPAVLARRERDARECLAESCAAMLAAKTSGELDDAAGDVVRAARFLTDLLADQESDARSAAEEEE